MITCEIFKSLKYLKLAWKVLTFLGLFIALVLYHQNLIGNAVFILSLLLVSICILIFCKDTVQKIIFYEKHIEIFYKRKTNTIYYIDLKSIKISKDKDLFWLFFGTGYVKLKSMSMSNVKEAMLFIKTKVETGELNHIEILYSKSSIISMLWGALIEFIVSLIFVIFE